MTFIKAIAAVFPFGVLLQCLCAEPVEQRLYLLTNAVKLPDPLGQTTSRSIFDCAAGCHLNEICEAVNYETSTGICEKVGFHVDPVPYTADGWQLIKQTKMMHRVNMTGAIAEQTSVLHTHIAQRAIDGNTAGAFSSLSCSHTIDADSFWLVELTSVVEIDGVSLYFRTECCWERLVNLQFLVSMSRQDSDDGIATDVGYYDGPPALSDNPVQIPFRRGIFGKVFKIKQEATWGFEVCEIILWSP